MRSYYSHLQATKTIGEELSLIQKPIFRSSAIFPVLHGKVYSSKIIFLGYWLLKRNISQLGLLYTLRGDKGNILARNYLLIEAAKAFEIAMQEFKVLDSEVDFQGSLELEIFSTVDLVFPYPAFVLVYYNDGFSTAVHTAGRIYNDLEDLQSNEEYKVSEAGFDVYGNDGLSPFIAFTNGPIENTAPTIKYEVVNCEGKVYIGQFTVPSIAPYETCFLEFNQHIDLPSMLLHQVGTIKVGHNLEGFFPRFISGNFDATNQVISITHTYYDSSSQRDAKAFWNRMDDEFNDSSVMIPVFVKDDFYTQLAIYPIFSPSDFFINFDFYNKNGELVNQLINYKHITSAAHRHEVIDIEDILINNNIDIDEIAAANIICNWKDKSKIPTRVKFGLNVGMTGKQVNLPCNICFAPNLGNPNVLKKAGTFRWAPFINIGQSRVLLTNSSPLKNYSTVANLKLEFFRELDGNTMKRALTLKANAILEIEAELDEELRVFFENKSGWLSVASDNPYVNGWYFDFSENGAVAGDHVF